MDAAYLGDSEAAKKWKVTTRTIENYRARLRTDPKLSEIFVRKRAAAEGKWATGLKRTLGSILDKARMIAEAVEPIEVVETELGQMERVNLPALKLLADAGKDFAEIALALEVLNAGDAQQNADAPASGSGVADRPALPN